MAKTPHNERVIAYATPHRSDAATVSVWPPGWTFLRLIVLAVPCLIAWSCVDDPRNLVFGGSATNLNTKGCVRSMALSSPALTAEFGPYATTSFAGFRFVAVPGGSLQGKYVILPAYAPITGAALIVAGLLRLTRPSGRATT